MKFKLFKVHRESWHSADTGIIAKFPALAEHLNIRTVFSFERVWFNRVCKK